MWEEARYTWRWRATRYGPLAGPLQDRVGEECRVFARGSDGKVGVEFADGYRVIGLRWAVRRVRFEG